MSEYYDIKHKPYKVTESVIVRDNREEVEEDLITELYKIFRNK